MAEALRLLAAAGWLLQWIIAAQVLRRHPLGPFRLLTGLLLLLNGAGALHVALAGQGPQVADRLFFLADGPTGILLVAAGALYLRFPRHDEWDRTAQWLAGGALAWSLLFIAASLTPAGYDSIGVRYLDILVTAPQFIGIGLMGFAAAWVIPRAPASRSSEPGLLAFGYVSTLASNSLIYLYITAVGDFSPILGGTPYRGAGTLAAVLLMLASVVVLAWPRQPNSWWRGMALLAALAGGLISFALNPVMAQDKDALYGWYLLYTASIYLVRPVCVGLVLARKDTLWSLYDTAAAVGLLALGKLASLVLFGSPADEFSVQDLAPMGVALLLLPAAWVIPRRLRRRRRRESPTPTLPADHRLATYLLHRFHDAGGPVYATKEEIEQATGITENNLAATVRRLERRLVLDATTPPGTHIAERKVGVRGRKEYLLTAAGAIRAEALLQGNLPPSKPAPPEAGQTPGEPRTASGPRRPGSPGF